jgi:hypothetical protein
MSRHDRKAIIYIEYLYTSSTRGCTSRATAFGFPVMHKAQVRLEAGESRIEIEIEIEIGIEIDSVQLYASV